MQLAAARHGERLRVGRLLDAQGDVPLKLPEQPVAQLAPRDVLPLPPREGRVVHLDVDGNRGLFHGDTREPLQMVRRGDRLADLHAREPRHRHDLARRRLLQRHSLEPLEAEQLDDARLLVRGVAQRARLPQRQERHRVAQPHPPPLDAPDPDSAEVGGVVERRDEHLERPVPVHTGRRDRFEDRLEQRHQGRPRQREIPGRRPVPARRIEEGAAELLRRRLKLQEQLQHFVVHAQRVRILAVDLVHEHDGLQPQRQRLPRHESRLRHRPFGRVHEQQEAVHHAQDPLHLAAEVGVAGRVHDVDLGVAPQPPAHGRVLREDRDAALPLERVRVEHPLVHLLVGTEHAGLAEHLIHQRRLTVVDVGDDGDVAELQGATS